MALFTPSRINLSSEILQLIETISRKQGELTAHKLNIHDSTHIGIVAAIDAVHFSTKIEGNALSRDQVTQVLQSKKKVKAHMRDLREVLNYSRVRRMVREWSLREKSFSDEWVLEHHLELLKGIVQGRLRGHYRTAQCVIQNSRTHEIVYMAAEWSDVPDFMKGLLSWLRKNWKEGVSPLLLAAQFHFEFVTIHPFMDGNGRLARLLTNGILLLGGYDVERYAALEKQHEKDRAGYYHALRSLQTSNFYDIPAGQDIGSWVVYWLQCLLSAYEEALERITGIKESSDLFTGHSWDARLQKARVLFHRYQHLRATDYADLLGVGRTQAVSDLNRLVGIGIIGKVGGGRSTVYQIRQVQSDKKARKSNKWS